MRLTIIAALVRRAIVPVLVCIVGVSLQGSAAPGSGAGGERVTFASADSTLGGPIPATVVRPAGSGPFPAVVALHGCDGISRDATEWARWLQGQGYVVVLPDSLAPRNLRTSCGTGGLKYDAQALDGLGALAYLRTRADVVRDKIAVMGWSHGGAATLISASARFVESAHPDGGGYRAAVALYPACGAFQEGTVGAPLLMLLGGADDWQPPARCVERGTALQTAGAPVEFKVYPGATHAFDAPGRPRTRNVPNVGVVHLQYDAVAAADAHTQVQRFFKTHLQ